MTGANPWDFETARLEVRHWSPVLADPGLRAALEADLAWLLRPTVLTHLPPTMELGSAPGAVSDWIDARQKESDVFLVRSRQPPRGLIGLLILARACDAAAPATRHLGYLLGQASWGQGYASELVAGLVARAADHAPMRLLGGVEQGNPASARVLQKSGFRRDPALSSSDTDMYAVRIDKPPGGRAQAPDRSR